MTENTPSSNTRPPKQSRTGLKANGTRKAASKSNRSRAREFALQALYQHIVGRNDAAAIDSFTRDLAGFHKADAAHYNAVLHGCINTAEDLDALITPLLDRKLGEAVDIYVNNRLVARGEVVMVEDNRLGVTMTEIVKADRAP